MSRTLLFRVICVATAAQAGFLQASFAQDGAKASNVEGMVAVGKVVGPNSEPQSGVPVMVEGPRGKTFAFTDQNGDWSLYNLDPGTYQVQPVQGTLASTLQPVVFTVKEKSFFGKLFGGEEKPIGASEIRLKEQFKQ